nr:hypothetical protein [Flavobacterium sp. ASV13]
MKKIIKKKLFVLKFILLLLLVFLSGCSTENEVLQNSNEQKSDFIFLHKNNDFVKANNSLINKLNSLGTQKVTSKSTNIQTDDFTIFTERVTYTKKQDQSRESYTFYIERNDHFSNKTMDNLVLTRNLGEENFKAYIISYYFPDGIASEHKNFTVSNFKEIKTETFASKKISAKTACSYSYEITETAHSCYTGKHSGNSQAGLCDGTGDQLPYSTFGITVLFDNCGSGAPGTIDDGYSPGGGSSGPGGGGNNNPGKGGPPVDTGMSLPPPCQTSDCDVKLLANDINDMMGNTLNFQQLQYLFYNDTQAVAVKLLLEQGNTSNTRTFINQIINQGILNPGMSFDIIASFYSPMNIDRSTIISTTPEGQKFNEIYEALKASPEFKRLFIDIFENSTRYNVKFVIEEHVYEDNNPALKEVNAITMRTPGTNNLVIKISKQILTSGTSMSQTKIENAKTILHECIHAYLFIKANYPSVGADFVNILNTMYPTVSEQHDFIYDKMIPTMQTVLSEIRDLVTTSAKRNILETQYIMHPTTNPLTSTSWIWNEYYKYISLKGLDEANCFKEDFPKESDQWKLFTKYIEYGHTELDK